MGVVVVVFACFFLSLFICYLVFLYVLVMNGFICIFSDAAEVSTANFNVDVIQTSDSWSLQGSCSITKAFSSRDQYVCVWIQYTPSSTVRGGI